MISDTYRDLMLFLWHQRSLNCFAISRPFSHLAYPLTKFLIDRKHSFSRFIFGSVVQFIPHVHFLWSFGHPEDVVLFGVEHLGATQVAGEEARFVH